MLESGDLFVLYTDGLTEATSTANEVLGQEGLWRWLSRERNLSAGDAIQVIRSGLKEFTSGKPADDDLTIVVCRVKAV